MPLAPVPLALGVMTLRRLVLVVRGLRIADGPLRTLMSALMGLGASIGPRTSVTRTSVTRTSVTRTCLRGIGLSLARVGVPRGTTRAIVLIIIGRAKITDDGGGA